MSEKKQKFEQAWIDEEEQREKWQRVIVEKPERPYHFTCTLSHYHGAAELWYNMCVFECRGRRVGGIALYHSWKTRNCVLCFKRKTGNLRRGRICGIAECAHTLCVPYSVFRQRVLGRASFEIQSGVRFFHVVRRLRYALKNGDR